MATEEVRSDKIHLEVVTPKGRALDISVDEVTAPGVGGEFGVMPGHVPALVALRTGIVSFRQGSDTTRVAVGTGFAEAGPNRVLVLTDEFVERSAIDPVLVRKELAEVDAKIPLIDPLAPGADQEELKEKRDVLIQRQNWLAAQLELYGDPPPATLRPYEEYGPTPMPEDEDTARHDAEQSSKDA